MHLVAADPNGAARRAGVRQVKRRFLNILLAPWPARRAAAEAPSATLPSPGLPRQCAEHANLFRPCVVRDGHLSHAASAAWPFLDRALQRLFYLVVRWHPPFGLGFKVPGAVPERRPYSVAPRRLRVPAARLVVDRSRSARTPRSSGSWRSARTSRRGRRPRCSARGPRR